MRTVAFMTFTRPTHLASQPPAVQNPAGEAGAGPLTSLWPRHRPGEANGRRDADPANNQPPGYVPPEGLDLGPAERRPVRQHQPARSPARRSEQALPVGRHPLQLYSMGTPNGVKVTIMLEELLAAGHAGAEYDAWLIRIGEGDQFTRGFVAVNPNSKIPAMMDHSTDPPTRLFESGSILVYLAEKFGAFLPTEHLPRAETFNWLMWQMGSAPVRRRRLRPFLRLCAVQDRICDQPLRDGDQAPAPRARHPSGEPRISGRRRIYDRRHGDLALVRQR